MARSRWPSRATSPTTSRRRPDRRRRTTGWPTRTPAATWPSPGSRWSSRNPAVITAAMALRIASDLADAGILGSEYVLAAERAEEGPRRHPGLGGTERGRVAGRPSPAALTRRTTRWNRGRSASAHQQPRENDNHDDDDDDDQQALHGHKIVAGGMGVARGRASRQNSSPARRRRHDHSYRTRHRSHLRHRSGHCAAVARQRLRRGRAPAGTRRTSLPSRGSRVCATAGST